MDYDILVDALDMDAVSDAIKSATTKLKQDDQLAAANMVLKAMKRWGVKDYATLRITGVEQVFAVEFPESGGLVSHLNISDEQSRSYGPRSVRGYVDLVGDRQQPDGGTVSTEVIDWKTTGSITPDQQDRLRYSWQGKLYGAVYRAKRVTFRSIMRDCSVKEITYEWPTKGYNDLDVCEHYGLAIATREVYRSSDKWLQHAPGSCSAFGRDCEFKSLCLVNNQAPRKLIELRPFSYSGSETFLLCPEKYRLETIIEDERESEATALGVAFHAGCQEAWTQIAKLQ